MKYLWLALLAAAGAAHSADKAPGSVLERGLQKAGKAIERGAKAAGRGVERGGRAVQKGAEKVHDKVDEKVRPKKQ
jgi:hypothetical protein